MAKWLAAVCLVFGLIAVSTATFAGANFAHKLAVHVKAHPTSCSTNYPTFTSCSQIVFTWPSLADVDVMPVFYDLAGYTRNETGLSWPEGTWGSGVWTRCKGDVAVGTITHSANQTVYPASTRGTAISWSSCQTTWGSAPGYCWLTAHAVGMVCPELNPATGNFGVLDCSAPPGPFYDWPISAHCAGVGGMVGDDPCKPVGVEPGTWGGIKGIFR
ncbi:MAG TPA: hypothetical protein VMU02_01270 [bacterium]|nr:hypothetical protein [bacterium]